MVKLEDLVVWQKAVDFSTAIYAVTKSFPADERFGLTSQLRRASVSIASNIAEGFARFSDTEFLRFLRIASGSLYEVRTQLLISKNVGILSGPDYETLKHQAAELERLLVAFLNAVEKRLG